MILQEIAKIFQSREEFILLTLTRSTNHMQDAEKEQMTQIIGKSAFT